MAVDHHGLRARYQVTWRERRRRASRLIGKSYRLVGTGQILTVLSCSWDGRRVKVSRRGGPLLPQPITQVWDTEEVLELIDFQCLLKI